MRSVFFLLLMAAPALADQLDEQWLACQSQREQHIVTIKRVAGGEYNAGVRTQCEAVEGQMHARPPPVAPAAAAVEAAAKAVITAPKK